MNNPPIVFISYSWKNQDEAEKIYNDLKQIGIVVKKDNHELKYKDDLRNFMQSIRNADFAILLISTCYLKSVNCMYEATHILKEKDIQSKILPVIIDKTNIYATHYKISIVKYWQKVIVELNKKLENINPINSLEIYAELKLITEISQMIDSFLKLITSKLMINFSELVNENYKPLLEAIGFSDISYLTELLIISHVKSDEKKDLLLDKYITRHVPNTYYYLIKANNCNRNKKYDQAKFNYLQSIKLKPDNFEAHNNLGMLYQHHYDDFKNAKSCFEKSIEIEPEFTIGRLNLGVLKSQHFRDNDGAKLEYEKILTYDEKEPKAHNNLAGYYKSTNPEKAEYHLKRAIELNPGYVEAYISYANLFKLRGETEKGNELYKVALKLDKGGRYTTIINALLESTKG